MGGQLSRPGKLAACSRERSRLIALELQRPRREHSGSLTRSLPTRRPVASGAPQLQPDALDLTRAAMPHQPALLDFCLPLIGRARCGPRPPDLHGAR